MKNQILEKELKGFERIKVLSNGYELLAKVKKMRIIYDPIKKEILLRYRERSKVFSWIMKK